jgi:hypothetical protein
MVIPVVMMIASLGGLAACEDLGQEPDPPFDAGEASQTIGGTRIVWAKSGRTSAVIRANVLRRFQDRSEVQLEDSVEVDLYDDDGRLVAIVRGDAGTIRENTRTAEVDSGITVEFLGTDAHYASVMTAQSAHADDRLKQVTARGDVRVISESGVSLSTNLLIWEGRRERFRAPGRVTLTNGLDIEEGENLVANADLTEWTMQDISGRTTRSADEINSIRERPTSSASEAQPRDTDGARLGF